MSITAALGNESRPVILGGNTHQGCLDLTKGGDGVKNILSVGWIRK